MITAVMAALLSTQAAVAQPAPTAVPAEIVIVGRRLKTFRAHLQACIARKCPPNEDVDASLGLAEELFVDGDYLGAERVIDASLKRNRRFARDFPEPVADLFRSQSRVQAHRGRDVNALHAARGTLRALSDGLQEEDYRHFTARLEIIQFLVRTRRYDDAKAGLRQLARVARTKGREDISRVADMRLLVLDYITEGEDGQAIGRLESMASNHDPAKQFESVTARTVLAGIYRDQGDVEKSEKMLANLPSSGGEARALLYAPSLGVGPDRTDPRTYERAGGMQPSASEFRRTWVDIGYWIQPDGRVADVEIVRHGARDDWARPLLRSVAGRRYSPSAGGLPSYRLERFTYVAPLDMNLRVPTPDPSRARVEVLDLTSDEEPDRAPDQAFSDQGTTIK